MWNFATCTVNMTRDAGIEVSQFGTKFEKKKKTQLKAVRITQSNFNYYTVHL